MNGINTSFELKQETKLILLSQTKIQAVFSFLKNVCRSNNLFQFVDCCYNYSFASGKNSLLKMKL